MSLRSLRGGAAVVANWTTALALEGRLFSLQFGTEDAPIDLTVAIDDQLVEACCDVQTNTTVIPAYAQGVVGVWTDTATLYNFMVEIDNAKTRYVSGGTAYTPLSLRVGSPVAPTSKAYVGTDVTVGAKTAGGSLEMYHESLEIDIGSEANAQYWPKMEYKPLTDARVPAFVVGPGSVLIHFGMTTGNGDATGYGSLQWFEIPSTMVTG
jgi:hypothetical protein